MRRWKMLKLELRRIWKKRSTWYLAAAALLLCLCFAILAVHNVVDYSGGELRGRAAIQANRELLAPAEGYVTGEKLRELYAKYQALSAAYDGGIIPHEVYQKEITPYFRLMFKSSVVYAAPDGQTRSFLDISPEEAADFYAQRKRFVESQVYYGSGGRQDIADYALKLDESVREPFYTEYGFGSGETEQLLCFCIFALAAVCAVLAAPVFSAGYSSGADDILRSTRRGRGTLARTKLFSCLFVSTGIFLLGTGAFLAVTLSAFGLDKSSAQFGYLLRPLVFANITENGFLLLMLLSGFLSLAAVVCMTLWFSSAMKSPVMVLTLSHAVILTPSLLSLLGRSLSSGGLGNFLNGLRLCLPSGGLGLSGMYTELGQGSFATAGPLIVWTPRLMLVAPLVEIPIFLLLAHRAYVRHQAA